MIHSLYLGRVAYDEALRLQQELVELRGAGRIADTLLLLEHPPVLTLGRHADRANILVSEDLLRSRGVTLHQINRGGDVTYHGPGQLVGYPIFDLRALPKPGGGRMGPVDFVRLMEEALIRLCAYYGVSAGRIRGLTGVWCPADCNSPNESTAETSTTLSRNRERKKKIAAIGIHVSRSITSHGFAFNLSTDLSGFSLIHPCGIAACPVTSLQLEIPEPASLPTLESFAHQAACRFGIVFSQPVLALESLAALRAAAEVAPANAPSTPALAFPAQDTPLQVPPEVERLRGAPQHRHRA